MGSGGVRERFAATDPLAQDALGEFHDFLRPGRAVQRVVAFRVLDVEFGGLLFGFHVTASVKVNDGAERAGDRTVSQAAKPACALRAGKHRRETLTR